MFEPEYPISQSLSATGGDDLGNELARIFQTMEQVGMRLFRWLGLLAAHGLIWIGHWLRARCAQQPMGTQAETRKIPL